MPELITLIATTLQKFIKIDSRNRPFKRRQTRKTNRIRKTVPHINIPASKNLKRVVQFARMFSSGQERKLRKSEKISLSSQKLLCSNKQDLYAFAVVFTRT